MQINICQQGNGTVAMVDSRPDLLRFVDCFLQRVVQRDIAIFRRVPCGFQQLTAAGADAGFSVDMRMGAGQAALAFRCACLEIMRMWDCIDRSSQRIFRVAEIKYVALAISGRQCAAVSQQVKAVARRSDSMELSAIQLCAAPIFHEKADATCVCGLKYTVVNVYTALSDPIVMDPQASVFPLKAASVNSKRSTSKHFTAIAEHLGLIHCAGLRNELNVAIGGVCTNCKLCICAGHFKCLRTIGI